MRKRERRKIRRKRKGEKERRGNRHEERGRKATKDCWEVNSL